MRAINIGIPINTAQQIRKKIPQYAMLCRAAASAVVAICIALDSIQQASGITSNPTKKIKTKAMTEVDISFSYDDDCKQYIKSDNLCQVCLLDTSIDRVILCFKSDNYEEVRMSQWQMFIDLWKVTKLDCRAQLIREFIFEPRTIERRWANEVQFQSNLKSGWRR